MSYLQFCGDVWLPSGSVFKFPSWFAQGLVCNLEGPITTHEQNTPGKICLKTDPVAFETAFTNSMPKAVCLANNHILDYGPKGFEETVDYLESKGIPYFGAGDKLNRFNNPLIMQVGDTTIALMGYVCPSTHPIFADSNEYGVVGISLEIIQADIRYAIKLGAMRVVVCLHWGDEEVWLPKPKDVETARTILTLGADLVIGHHAHCQQPVLVENKKHIFFGLGNAHFPDFEYWANEKLVGWWKLRKWNRTTTLVTYKPKSGEVCWRVCLEHKGTLNTKLGWGARQVVWKSKSQSWPSVGYERMFSLAKRLSTCRLVISRFIARPRWPSIQSLVHAFRAIKNGN